MNKLIKIYTSSFGEDSLVAETRYTDIAKSIIDFLWENNYQKISIDRFDDFNEMPCEESEKQ